ncbi:MAG TPA: SWIM zinc finger family protein [Paenibacillus sp.]
MNLKYTLDDTQWQILIQKVGESFNDLTIKRGFQYFKQERVQPVKISNPEQIEGLVEGNDEDKYRVTLNLDSLSESRCTCPVPNYCKHMIAVLLNYVSQQGRSVHAIVNANSTAMFKQTTKSSTHHATSSQIIDRNKEAQAKLREQASRIPSMSIKEWHELFKQSVSPIGFNSPNAGDAKKALASINNLQPQLSPVVERLFKLHAHLFVLEKLVHPLQNSGTHRDIFIGYHTQVAADDMHEEVQRILRSTLMIPAEPEQWPRMKETINYLRSHMLVESKNLRYFSEIYDQLWLQWIHPNLQDETLNTAELEHLKSAQSELGTTLSKLPWLLAQCQMYFYLAQDGPAWELLQQANKGAIIPPGRLLHFLHVLSSTEQWPRLQDWLINIGPMLSSLREEHLNEYVACWDKVIQHFPDAEQHLWNSLVDTLPYSKNIYEEALLTHGKWQQWMDYQLSIGKEPLDFRVSVMQPIDKNAPELLLPFYHQAVERYILLKNRASYKAAVKLLKRLSKLYKRLKQEERWEQFITAFASRHSRLRALQEELRKGKLIS